MSESYPLSPFQAKKHAVKQKRDAKMFKLFQTGKYTMREIGAKFGVTQTTVHHAIYKFKRQQQRKLMAVK